MMTALAWMICLACGDKADDSSPPVEESDTDTDADTDTDTDADSDTDTDADADADADPFADALISFLPGTGAGFGQENLPDVVLGSPEGGGASAGSLHVVSLGCDGEIVLAFTDVGLVDGEGPDLLVFENPFPGFMELGRVAVSDDLEAWAEWPCDTKSLAGCAGVQPVLATSTNGVDATDPAAAGGDAFDLADLGVKAARYVRITDAGVSGCGGNTGGFDLDAIAVVNGAELAR